MQNAAGCAGPKPLFAPLARLRPWHSVCFQLVIRRPVFMTPTKQSTVTFSYWNRATGSPERDLFRRTTAAPVNRIVTPFESEEEFVHAFALRMVGGWFILGAVAGARHGSDAPFELTLADGVTVLLMGIAEFAIVHSYTPRGSSGEHLWMHPIDLDDASLEIVNRIWSKRHGDSRAEYPLWHSPDLFRPEETWGRMPPPPRRRWPAGSVPPTPAEDDAKLATVEPQDGHRASTRQELVGWPIRLLTAAVVFIFFALLVIFGS